MAHRLDEKQARRWLATNDRRWRKIRGLHLQREPLCRYCKAQGRLIPGNHVDHINGRADRAEDYCQENLQTLCGSCHSAKTQAQEAGKEFGPRGCDEAGVPINPSHHWHQRH